MIRQNINGLRHYLDDQDRIWVPGVTSIIGRMLKKEGLENWKKKTPNYRSYASNEAILGSLKHLRILQRYTEEELELVDLPSMDWMTEDRLDQLQIAEAMWESLELEVGWPRRVEHTVYRREHPRCAGSLDILAQLHAPEKWSDGLSLMDLKSSKSPQSSHKIQLGAYFTMLPEELQEATERGIIIYLHTQVANNPYLKPLVVPMEKKELVQCGEKFLDMARAFWELYEGK